MKKLFFSVAFLAFSGIISANTITIKSEIEIEVPISKVCCIRSATSTAGEVVTAKCCVPSTGDTVIDRGHACERAQNAANALVVALEESPAN
ncbi:hypothetical protein [Flavobacterium sp.]|jgi:hypothetical protein|uniref:hypothetical protein n=1 Tax=Flavobacterium sp. TaxID=239 RepID=UPI0037BEC17A